MQSKIINIDIYKRDVMVCFCDKVMLERKLKQYDIDRACLQEILDDIDDSSTGRSFSITDSGPFLLWMPRTPGTAEEFGTLSQGIGAEFSDDSEEPYAYLVGYLTEKILKAFKITLINEV